MTIWTALPRPRARGWFPCRTASERRAGGRGVWRRRARPVRWSTPWRRVTPSARRTTPTRRTWRWPTASRTNGVAPLETKRKARLQENRLKFWGRGRVTKQVKASFNQVIKTLVWVKSLWVWTKSYTNYLVKNTSEVNYLGSRRACSITGAESLINHFWKYHNRDRISKVSSIKKKIDWRQKSGATFWLF